MSTQAVTRRDFLRSGAAGAAGAAVLIGSQSLVTAADTAKSRVVLVRREDVLDKLNKPNQDIVSSMLNEAVRALTGAADDTAAWKTLFKANDTVGIKNNNWKNLATTVEVETAIQNGVMLAGVPKERMSVDDRGVRSNEIFKKATALVNARPMRTHHWAGVGSLLKNYIMFAERPSDYHADTCADLAKLYMLPETVGRTKLNVLVMLTPLFHGVGPHHFSPEYVWRYNGLLVGTDPVAVDATGLRIILAKRKQFFGEDRPINPPPHHIALADTRHKLGNADPAKIELVTLGWDVDRLI